MSSKQQIHSKEQLFIKVMRMMPLIMGRRLPWRISRSIAASLLSRLSVGVTSGAAFFGLKGLPALLK